MAKGKEMGLRAKRRLIFGLAVVGLLVAVFQFRFFSSYMNEVLEPRPDAVDARAEAASYSNERAIVRMDEILYVYRDTPLVIFVGTIEDKQGKSLTSASGVLPEAEFKRLYPDRYGEIRCFRSGTRYLWGVLRSTSEVEGTRSADRFRKRWAECVAAFESRPQ